MDDSSNGARHPPDVAKEATVLQALGQLQNRVEQLEEASVASALQGLVAAWIQQWTAVVGTLHDTLPGLLRDAAAGVRDQLAAFLRETSAGYAAAGVLCAMGPAVLHRVTWGLLPGIDSFMVQGTATIFGCLMMGRLLHEGTQRGAAVLAKVGDPAFLSAHRRQLIRGGLFALHVVIGGYRVYWMAWELRALRLTVGQLRTENERLQHELRFNDESLAAAREKARGLAQLLGVLATAPAAPAPDAAPAKRGPWRRSW
eukprot:EG_transcript_17360